MSNIKYISKIVINAEKNKQRVIRINKFIDVDNLKKELIQKNICENKISQLKKLETLSETINYLKSINIEIH